MSNKSKYICTTALFTAASICAYFAAYRFIGASSKITADEQHTQIASYTEANDTAAATGEPDELNEPEAAEASLIADKTNENTVIVYEYYYEHENKTQRTEQKAPNALVNLTREQLIARIEGFSVVSFSPEEVVLRKRISRSVGDRYILGIWDGYVAVFYSESGISLSGLKEVTDTPATSLSADERQRLKNGVIIEGGAELMKVLEDYGS